VLTLGKSTVDTHHFFLDNNTFQLKNVDQETDLGITIDSKLSFDQHVHAKVNRANSITGLIRRTFSHLDEENVQMLYKARLRPHLEYGNAIWHPHKVEHITAIEIVQRRATKLIPAIKDLPYSERRKHIHRPTLAYRRLRGDMIEIYTICNTYDQASHSRPAKKCQHYQRTSVYTVFKQIIEIHRKVLLQFSDCVTLEQSAS
jgi:hypothetical protein